MPEMWDRLFCYSNDANAGLEAGLYGLWILVHAHSERLLACLSPQAARLNRERQTHPVDDILVCAA